jgi:uncharacterized protein DUF4124
MTFSYQPRRMVGAALGFALWTAIAAPAAAQIFKCTDASGNVTYQNEACAKNLKAGRVDIFDNSWTADRAEKEAEWRRNAASHRVVTGMPQRWVRDALGEPAEIRNTATAGAAEVWSYSLPDRSVQVGILGEQVVWVRETPVQAPLTRAAPGSNQGVPNRGAADAMRPSEPPRAAQEIEHPALTAARPAGAARAIARGQDCRQALAELGTPARQREVSPLDSASDPATEYIYESADGSSPTRTRVVCANGKVEGIDRSVGR